MSSPRFDTVHVGDRVPALVRTTDFAHWNRYAAVNDEFVPIHMDHDDARAAGQPAAFGMGNLRIAYLHNALGAWLGGSGGVVVFSCQFRALNFKGDTLSTWATVTGKEIRDGAALVHLDLGVTNQDGVDTTPGTATVQLWDGAPDVLPDPGPLPPSGDAGPGVFLTQAEIDLIDTRTEPVASWPVGVNDIRKWSLATHWPEPAPATMLDEAAAAAGPWRGMVAPPEFEPFAWSPRRAFGGAWMRPISNEPGHRILNGGQRSLYFAPIRPGDVITGVTRLVDVVEKKMRLGPTSVFTAEHRLTNQHGQLVRLGYGTVLYY